MLNDKGTSTYEAEFGKVCARAITPLAVVGGEGPAPCP
jgi:hypothetical protein